MNEMALDTLYDKVKNATISNEFFSLLLEESTYLRAAIAVSLVGSDLFVGCIKKLGPDKVFDKVTKLGHR
jgi:hypothetical protein